MSFKTKIATFILSLISLASTFSFIQPAPAIAVVGGFCCSQTNAGGGTLSAIDTAGKKCNYVTAGVPSDSAWSCGASETCTVANPLSQSVCALDPNAPPPAGVPGSNGFCCAYGGTYNPATGQLLASDGNVPPMRYIKRNGVGRCIITDCLSFGGQLNPSCLVKKGIYEGEVDSEGTMGTGCQDASGTNPGESCNINTNTCIPLPPDINSGAVCTDANGGQKPGVQTAIGCIRTDPEGFVSQMVAVGIGIGSGLAFLSLMYGAYKLTTSQGNPEGLNTGKEIITSAIIGLTFIILSVAILTILGFDILGLGPLGLGTR
jgi:hypothetical protein